MDNLSSVGEETSRESNIPPDALGVFPFSPEVRLTLLATIELSDL